MVEFWDGYVLPLIIILAQILAIVVGGIAGVACFIGLSLLIHRRLFDPRIRY